MKKETRENALALAYSMMSIPESAVDAANSSSTFKVLPIDMMSDNGNQMMVKISLSVLDVDGSEKTAPFVLEDAVALYEQKQADKAAKAANAKSKKDTSKPSETAERTEQRMKALRDWWAANAEYGENYTSKQVFQALPELYAEDGRGIMLTGSDLARLAKEGFAEMEMVDKKKTYVKK